MTNILALTMGDPAGIGPEICARTLAEVAGEEGHRGVVVGDVAALQRGIEAAGVSVEARAIESVATPPVDGKLDVVDTGVLGEDLPAWGVVDRRAGQAAVAAIEQATRLAMDGEVAGIVTGPINKEAIWAAGSEHLGHTEMLGALTGVTKQDTMFVVRNTPAAEDHHLRIFFTTRHVSLAKAVQQLRDIDLISDSIRRAYRALQVFGVDEPRLAVAALNPHGGESGNFGDEEIEFIGPAVERVRAEGLDVAGPVPADSVFHQGLMGRYDGVLSHFHDQGHIPAKTFDFDGTISVTVGLPILRTSVDHGTAFDIAGSGKAGHGTMMSAYRAGVEYAPFAQRIRAAYGNDPE